MVEASNTKVWGSVFAAQNTSSPCNTWEGEFAVTEAQILWQLLWGWRRLEAWTTHLFFCFFVQFRE